jgi:DNA-binding response OmpR family regulator
MSSIVIYERDDLMYALLREWLGAAGYSVKDAPSPPGSDLRVDLVILGIPIPQQENEAIMRVVRRLHPHAAVLALSSHARSGLSSDGAAAKALGVKRVMAKPLTRSELLAAVEAIIGPPKPSP